MEVTIQEVTATKVSFEKETVLALSMLDQLKSPMLYERTGRGGVDKVSLFEANIKIISDFKVVYCLRI